jgi:large subunit ribosomal protein L21
MYAVIKTGGKQYRVRSGEEILVEKLDIEPGQKVSFDEVLLVSLADKFISDPKQLKKAKVVGIVLEQLRDEKIEVFKYRPKKRYRRKQGHRQYLTKVKVEEISLPGLKKLSKPKKTEEKVAKAKKVTTKKEEKKSKVSKQTKAKSKVEVKLSKKEVKKKTEKKTVEKAAKTKAKSTTKKSTRKETIKKSSSKSTKSASKKSTSKVEKKPKKS